MAEPDDAQEGAQPVPNPDAQTTVNDFLDYTEFFPSDLVRSLTLIGDLDSNYRDAVQQVHDLTALYGKLPTIAADERPDPVALRKQIAQHLQKAINQREYAYAEASRLHEVAVRHWQRSTIIKRKLQAQPEPPSRDPTPPPVSPTAQRSYVRTYERAPHLRLNFDGGRQGASSSRPRDRHRKPGALPRRRSRAHSASSASSDGESVISVGPDISPRKQKQSRDRHPKPARVRAPGVLGTNVHSSIAGISTSNALALLAPPPPDAAPGSKWAPWMKLTEYEMAVLRKQMKKNAVWTPSLTMVNRELERKHRTREDYEQEKARCEAAGEEILDEEPESLQQIMTASGLGQLAPTAPAAAAAAAAPAPVAHEDADQVNVSSKDDISIRLKPIETKDGRKLDRVSQRQQAMRDALELENATSKLQQAADSLKELTFTSQHVQSPASQKRKTPSRPSNKRKRDTTPLPSAEYAGESDREGSILSQDSASGLPEPKRPRLQLSAPVPDTDASPIQTPTSEMSTPVDALASNAVSPTTNSVGPKLENVGKTGNGNTVQVPLAPAGPSTPKVNKNLSKEASRPSTPHVRTTIERAGSVLSPGYTNPALVQEQAQPQQTLTAAASRPRRESAVPKATSPTSTGPPIKASKASTPGLESAPEVPVHFTRPRSSRGHVPMPKAQSEEPKAHEVGRRTRESRRHSIFSQSALAAPPTRRTRKKPQPKGEVTSTKDGPKTVSNSKRTQGTKNKKIGKTEEGSGGELENVEEDDSDDTRYCICDKPSDGKMICCDNNCEREWFHFECVGLSEEPTRRSMWFCPDCRKALGTDAWGNPLVPPPLPGRRGNR